MGTYALKAGEGWTYREGIEHGYTIRSNGPVRLLVVTYPASVTPGRGWRGFIANVETQGELLSEPDDEIRY